MILLYNTKKSLRGKLTKTLLKIIFLFVIFLNNLHANTSILILNSYHKGYALSDNILKGIEEVLYKDANIDVNILYMDAKRINSKEYFESLKKLYTVQLKNQEYDLIITIDDFAYKFILDNYYTFFTNEKIFAVAIDDYLYNEVKILNLEKKISAYIQRYDLPSNIKLINEIMPDLENLYIIDDSSNDFKISQNIINEIKDNYKNINNITYLKANNLEELKKKFSFFQKKSALLFIRFYKNTDGKLNKSIKISEFIKSSKVPVFITDSIFISKGALGGRIVNLNKLGKNSAKMALEFIHTSQVMVKVSSDLEYVFDHQKLKEFDLSPLKHVRTYNLVNKDKTFFANNRALINYVFLFSPFLLILIFALIINIYKRFELEKILKERIHFDNVMLNAIESPIFWQDKKGIIIDTNTKFCDLINMSSDELNNKKLEDLTDNKKVKVILDFLYKHKDQNDKNFRFSDKKLNEKIYLIKQAKYFDKQTDSSGIVTIFTDITSERAMALERKRKQQYMLQQSKLAELGEIFASIAHQWKSPLVEITTIAQEIFYSSSTTSSEKESYVGDIMKQVKYMTDTMNDFQEFIKPSHNKSDFCVKEAINSMLDIVNHNIKYNYINININIKKDTKLIVNGYRNEFMQSFLNIINNAKDELIKHDFNNRNINISIFNEKNNLIILIKDNAGGIKKKYLDKIFTPYFSTKSEGHGLGLYMTKMIIEDKMDGQVSVENIDNGACFTIKIGIKDENTST